MDKYFLQCEECTYEVKRQKHAECGCLEITFEFLILLCSKQCDLSPLILKVIICTDGKANTDLGNLEVEDNDARTLLSSTIFYQDLGEYAAKQGLVHICKSMSSMGTVFKCIMYYKD